MVFEWEPNDELVEAVIADLPAAARGALAAFMDAVVFDPVDFGRTPDEPLGKAVRQLHFGGGRGVVTFQVYEPDRLVLVLRIVWAG